MPSFHFLRSPCVSGLLILFATLLSSCASFDSTPARPEWAIAIHGGAGVPENLSNPDEYAAILERALRAGTSVLAAGGTSVEAVTAVVVLLEDDPHFNAGRGAVLTSEGNCELDASIMDGSDRNCGAVASVTTVKNPILLARKVMTESRHVFLVGGGAEKFAEEQGFTPIDNEYFKTERRRRSLREVKAREAQSSVVPRGRPEYLGTVGAVALDRNGHLAAATSTGGLTNKRYGRVGDSPIIGAGTYADDQSCAVSCTGQGELYIRNAISHSLAALVLYGRVPLEAAAAQLIFELLPADSGGLIAIDRHGQITMPYNTAGMHRGCADATGKFQVSIFDEPVIDGAELP